MKFKSNINIFGGLVLLGISFACFILFVYILFGTNSGDKPWFSLILILSTSIFLGWAYFQTSYTISAHYIHYKSGPLRGKIKIAAIKEIKRGNLFYVGFKPALGTKGIIIKYDQFNDIYISPEKESVFIGELLNQNPLIKVCDIDL